MRHNLRVPNTKALLRHGLDRTLYRVTMVTLFENQSCEGNQALHRVDAIAVGTGVPAWWHITTGEAIRQGWANDADLACQWFALCPNDATHTQSHPVLGDVPICERCQAKYDAS